MYRLKPKSDEATQKKLPTEVESLVGVCKKIAGPIKGPLTQLSELEGGLHEAAELISSGISVNPEDGGSDRDVVGDRH